MEKEMIKCRLYPLSAFLGLSRGLLTKRRFSNMMLSTEYNISYTQS
jgi:hypothetical protein